MAANMLISPPGAEFLTRMSAQFIYGTIILGASLRSLAAPSRTTCGRSSWYW